MFSPDNECILSVMDKFSFADLKRLLTPGLYISVTALIIGLAFFWTQWAYSEDGHLILIYLYISGCFALLLMLNFGRAYLSGLTAVFLIVILGYAFVKFEWRRDYINQADKGYFPALERYIDHYPTFEENFFAGMIGSPRWIDFSEDCYHAALAERSLIPQCRSTTAIEKNYNIDLNNVINTHYAKMRKTANMLQKGQLSNKNIYRSCLQSKQCAFIPLLPAEADLNDNNAYLDVRRQFWSIINNKTIQPEVCNFVDLCRVMSKASVIRIEQN